MNSDTLNVMVLLGSLVVAMIATYAAMSVISVVRKRLEPGGETGSAPTELDAIRARLAATETLEARVGELEERLDFAERMLARDHEPERLPAGQSLDSPH